MRFVASILAASAVLAAAAPASAATYLVTAVGEGNQYLTICRQLGCTFNEIEYVTQRVRIDAQFYLTSYGSDFLFPRDINNQAFSYFSEIGQQGVNFERVSAYGGGVNLLAGGSGSGRLEYYQFGRSLQTAFSVDLTFNTRLLNDNDTSGSFSYTATAVPEPVTWAMMIAGFGLLGSAVRRYGVAPRWSTRNRLIEA